MTLIPRYLLEKHFGGDQRMIRAMEEQSANVEGGVAATSALKDATVIVLSPNGDFTNERVLAVGDGIDIDITGDKVTLSVKDVALTEGYSVKFIAQGVTELVLPPQGTLVSSSNPAIDLATIGNYANDAAAAAGGVMVGQVYRNASALMVRVV